MVKARKCLAKGCTSYLAYVIDTKLGKKEITDVDVVREFPDVFPEDLPGLPPERQDLEAVERKSTKKGEKTGKMHKVNTVATWRSRDSQSGAARFD
ncbi:hypothetical protein OSB04_007870 [Centaurea solstitialis]|uniref:Uncharacterized protein n=1 Tax=Centaurea solstitialis TaxID=347529 RepID=A0AA38TKP4_9ASTR|nr:hypothetical protein OSB04_007870 [Centaurea solstitialis]